MSGYQLSDLEVLSVMKALEHFNKKHLDTDTFLLFKSMLGYEIPTDDEQMKDFRYGENRRR